MEAISEYPEIRLLKEKVFFNALLAGSILGAISFLLSLVSHHYSTFTPGIYIDLTALLILFVTLLFSKKLSIKIQSVTIIISVCIFIFTDIYRHAVFSDNKILLILIPFFAYFSYSLRNSIVVFLIGGLIYMAMGMLFILGIVKPLADYNIRAYSIDVWILNFLLISIISFIVVIVQKQFSGTYQKLIEDLKNQNVELENYKENLEHLVSDRTRELEAVNEELKASNTDLYEKSQIISEQNTELSETMQNLKEAQSQLVQSEKMASLGVLTAGVAHEINNPLNFILGGYLGLNTYFEETGQKQNERAQVLLNSIKVGVDRASDIVKGLNQFSRSTDNLTEEVKIHGIIDNCLIILNNQFKNKIEIKKQYPEDPLKTKGNSGKLHQVFLNVLSNAIQAIDNSGIISITISKNKKDLSIEITDTGCGISQENISKITDPFFTTKDPGKGTGLGLSIAYTIINEHQGSMEFKSELNKGTTISITLPLYK